MAGVAESGAKEQRPTGKFQLWLKRVGWMLMIWAGSIIALAAAAYLMRFLMNAAGLNA
jgi:hypothetical protein